MFFFAFLITSFSTINSCWNLLSADFCMNVCWAPSSRFRLMPWFLQIVWKQIYDLSVRPVYFSGGKLCWQILLLFSSFSFSLYSRLAGNQFAHSFTQSVGDLCWWQQHLSREPFPFPSLPLLDWRPSIVVFHDCTLLTFFPFCCITYWWLPPPLLC